MIEDVVAQGVAGGWKTWNAAELNQDLNLRCDAIVVGTGAGGGMAAEALTRAGLDVVMVEEGPMRSSSDFNMEERKAYPDLYQEQAARKTADKAITVLQGRCVGGGTTVNWTSSFATPDQTLQHWQSMHGVRDCESATMAPYFERAKQRLNIQPWAIPPNPNNEVLRRGADKLGWHAATMNRNVKGCANLGYCGVGCPINAKQSMLITTIPAALDRGARLISRARAFTLRLQGDRVTGLECHALDNQGIFPTGIRIRVDAEHIILAGGAIGSPALLMRSKVPDPYRLVGARTFLHPVVGSAAVMPDPVNPFSGAPQSVYSDEFLWWDGASGRMGYKLEVPPLHPLLTSTVFADHGQLHRSNMERLPYAQAMLALCRDGFHADSVGGQVKLKDDGTPVLDYAFTDYVWDGMRRAFASMAELQFAAGAKTVLPLHRHLREPFTRWQNAKKAIDDLALEPLLPRIFSAHVMGGCAMGEDPQQAVVDSRGKHHHLQNLYVFDGSVFPTSIGSNPQVSIYGMTLKNVGHFLKQLERA